MIQVARRWRGSAGAQSLAARTASSGVGPRSLPDDVGMVELLQVERRGKCGGGVGEAGGRQALARRWRESRRPFGLSTTPGGRTRRHSAARDANPRRGRTASARGHYATRASASTAGRTNSATVRPRASAAARSFLASAVGRRHATAVVVGSRRAPWSRPQDVHVDNATPFYEITPGEAWQDEMTIARLERAGTQDVRMARIDFHPAWTDPAHPGGTTRSRIEGQWISPRLDRIPWSGFPYGRIWLPEGIGGFQGERSL